jgi:hypothetical protein
MPMPQFSKSLEILGGHPGGEASIEAAETPQHAYRFRIVWRNYRGHHDWIGKPAGRRGNEVRRKPPPPEQCRDFATIAEAEAFRALLIAEIGRDNLADVLLDLGRPTPPRPEQMRLPGEWPLQRRPSR